MPPRISSFSPVNFGDSADCERSWGRTTALESKVRAAFVSIADEVVTGFGRTGKMFAMGHFWIVPDLMTTGKGISSLYAPLAAVRVSEKVNAPFAEGAYFIHGFTNDGHPVTCAVGSAVLDILKEDRLVENSTEVGADPWRSLTRSERTMVEGDPA